jgi:hypothetical protein
MHRLYGLLKLDNLRLNINLFEIFVLPQYRLALTLYARQSPTAMARTEAHMRVWCKKFARIPINTAGHTFELIAGDLKTRVETTHRKVKRKLSQRESRDEQETRIEEGPAPEVRKSLKYLPRNLSAALRALYGNCCRQHNMTCLTTTHLREEHGIDIDLPRLLVECQKKQNRLAVKHQLHDLQEYGSVIQVARGPKIGRRRGSRQNN